jgi:hypothetical protein
MCMHTSHRPLPHDRARRARSAGGFTLMETGLALVIVGTGVLASMQLFTACVAESGTAANATVARLLAENVRETMANLPVVDPVSGAARWGPEDGEALASYNDLDDFDGKVDPVTGKYKGEEFSPPIDAMREKIPALSQYKQLVTVMPVNPNDPAGNANESAPTLPKGTYTGAVRVRVRVKYRQSASSAWVDLYTTSWVRAAG